MGITLDGITLQPIKAASSAPAAAAAIVAPPIIVADPSRGSRRDSKNDRGKDQPLSFRAVLNATAAGSIKTETPQAEAAKAEPEARPARVPDSSPTELNGAESSVLLDAAYARRGESSNGQQRVHLAATSRYAQAFFADTRTYARPGESLELTV